MLLLSFLIGVIACYGALGIALSRARSTGASLPRLRLAGGAIAMGNGIWSMHLLSVLAFAPPSAVPYGLPMTFLSLVFAIIASGIVLYTLKCGSLNYPRLLIAGAAAGAGIACMHYAGMAALNFWP